MTMLPLDELTAALIERNQFVGAPLRGLLPQVPHRAALPTAGEPMKYRLIVVRGTPDIVYVCLRNAAGTWGWRQLNTPLSSAYTPTNVTTDRAYDANATTIDELADVLGTLIADLQSAGILG